MNPESLVVPRDGFRHAFHRRLEGVAFEGLKDPFVVEGSHHSQDAYFCPNRRGVAIAATSWDKHLFLGTRDFQFAQQFLL